MTELPLERFLPGTHIARGVACSKILASWTSASAPGGRVVVVSGPGIESRRGEPLALLQRLRAAFPSLLHLTVEGEPSDTWVDRARIVAGSNAEAVVSIGGGSALDAGKALAAMLTESDPTIELLEGVGRRKPSGEMKPWFAAPTTAGTGSEASTNAVLSRRGPNGFKKSLRHAHYSATGIVLDPMLCQGAPPLITAACGMDAFTQLLESWSSTRVPPELEPWLEEGLAMAYQALPAAVASAPEAPLEARQALLDAACLSGIGLTRAGLGTAHGLVGTAGAVSAVPHSIACARLAGPCLRETVAWLGDHGGSPPMDAALDKFQRLRRRLTAEGPDAFEQIFQWATAFAIPPLTQFGLGPSQCSAILAAGSDRQSPATLGPVVWQRILDEALAFRET